MVSFDQVSLLQEKVESAVQKIVELKAENDALRNKCSELTNALSEKTELLNSLTADEQKIESSINSALDRLATIEDSILSQAGQKPLTAEPTSAQKPVAKPVQTTQPVQTTEPAQQENLFNPDTTIEPEIEESNSSDNSSSNNSNEPEEKFDIF